MTVLFSVLIYEINLRNYRISSSKHPRSLFNFESCWYLVIRGQRLENGGGYFKVREKHHIKFQKFFFVMKTSKYQQKVQSVCIIISYEFICDFTLPVGFPLITQKR